MRGKPRRGESKLGSCFRPSGARSRSLRVTPDLRPGLHAPAPPGLRTVECSMTGSLKALLHPMAPGATRSRAGIE